MAHRTKWLSALVLLTFLIGFCAGVLAQRAGVPTWIKRTIFSLRAERFLKTNHPPSDKRKSEPTAGRADLNDEPNQPILVVVSDEDPENAYGNYLTEILLAEGLHAFQTIDLSHVTPAILKVCDVVILTRMQMQEDQVETFGRYVADGGNLLVLRPDKKLAPMLGLRPTSAVLRDRYIRLPAGSNLAESLVSESIQFHGEADVYEPNGAQIAAFLCDQADGFSSVPAVTIREYGQGKTACFVYDLACSVALTRQGNPALAGRDSDGLGGFRPNDLFCDFIDPDRDWIPQADIHQHILSDVILKLAESRKPLPRWYCLPKASRAMLIMTGDGCGSPKIDSFVQEADAVESFGGSVSFYLFFDVNPVVTRDVEATLLSKGHSTSIHPFFACVPAKAEEAIRRDLASYVIRFGHWPRTIRTHNLSWAGYVESPKAYRRNGFRMDLSYVSYLPGLDGYMTGSALPMRFVDPNGCLIDVYQQSTQLEDDVQMGTWHGQGLSLEEATKRSVDMLRQSIERFHEPIVMNIHPAHYARLSGGWARNTMAYAHRHNVPIWSADRWLAFWESREAARFADLAFRDSTLSFNIQGRGLRESLTLMIPAASKSRQIRSLCIGGCLQAFSLRSVWGQTYALVEVDVQPDKQIAIVAAYGQPRDGSVTTAAILSQ
jgi:hypothetical protein